MSSVVVAGQQSRRRLPVAALAAVGACALVTAIVTAGNDTGSKSVAPAVGAPAPTAGGTPLDKEIARTQQHLRDVPRDYQAWATLGFDYVQQAKLTVDPTYYPKSAAALARSLSLNHRDNFLAMAGQASLAAARHDFHAALHWARRGLRIDPQSAVLYGALTDALTQLGRYDAATRAATHMEDLSPGTPAESRLSYAAELRGDHATAVRLMRRALSDAASASDVAFARYYLGQLALGAGQAETALRQFGTGLEVSPADTTLLEGRARAEAALGQTSRAISDYRVVVRRVPQPSYVLEFGELLQRQGRTRAAQQQWQLFRTEERLFRANGVTLDVDQVLFEADHGSVAIAVRTGAQAVKTRPFLDTDDAYGWALHRAGADTRALHFANLALHTGVRNALFYFHRGVIERTLGQFAAARRDLAVASSIDPTFNQR